MSSGRRAVPASLRRMCGGSGRERGRERGDAHDMRCSMRENVGAPVAAYRAARPCVVAAESVRPDIDAAIANARAARECGGGPSARRRDFLGHVVPPLRVAPRSRRRNAHAP
nr:hypothetical protein [Burkholderia humptydooensis]